MRHTFPAHESDRGRRLDVFLAEHLPLLSRSRIQQLLARGKVTLEGPAAKELKAGYRLRGGEVVSIEVEPPAPLRAYPEALPLDILYEDDGLVAINKPAGMVVHIGAGVGSGTLVNALLHHFRTLSQVGGELRPGIVHRLDRNTSGVLLVAKNDGTHRQLAAQFARRSVEKTYLALVHGAVRKEEGSITAPIRRDPARRVRMTALRPRAPFRPRSSAAAVAYGRRAARQHDGRSALSRYRVLRRFQGFTLLEVQIITGRTHQVRVHLASIGHPVVGDTLYGAPARLPAELFPQNSAKRQKGPRAKEERIATLGRNFLHAARIRFLHPRTGTQMEISAPLPPELQAFLARLLPL